MQNGISHLRLVASGGELVVTAAGATLAEQLIDFVGCDRLLRFVEFTYGPARIGWRLKAAGCSVRTVDLATLSSGSLPSEWYGAFDVAIAPSVLHQSANPEALLAEIASCVRPGGVCGGLEPAPDEFGALDIPHYARAAGLEMIDTFEPDPNPALFWRARVPALISRPRPFLTLVA